MSKTVSMVRTGGRQPVRGRNVRRSKPIRGTCTWCCGPLVDGIGVIEGRFLRNALVCGPCGRLGVRCTCDRRLVA